jgi:hypothetical protein
MPSVPPLRPRRVTPWIIALGAALAAAPASTAWAQLVVDQQSTRSSAPALNTITPGTPYGQSFTPGATNLAGARFVFQYPSIFDPNSPTLTLRLFASPTFTPGEVALAAVSRTITFGAVGVGVPFDLLFATPVGTVPGRQYFLELSATSPAHVQFIAIGGHGYAGGDLYAGPGAARRIANGADLVFGTYTDPQFTQGPSAVVPEPATCALVSAGLAGLAAVRHRRVRRST